MSDNTDLIIKLRAETKHLKADLNRAKSQMKRFQSSTSKIGKGIQKQLMLAVGGVALVAGIKAAVSSLAKFEFQMSKLKAVSGATEAQFIALSNSAVEIAESSKFTAIEVGRLQTELAKLGFTSSQILNATDAIRQLATVADSELGDAAKSVAGSINSFNLSSKDAARVSNVMAESFSKSALDLEKFTVATSNSGAIANAFGVTIEENTARMAALVDANIDASKAGTDLRQIMLELNTVGISYNDALKQVAESSDKAGTAQELVGKRAAGALVILSQQEKKVNELTAAFSDSNHEMGGMVDIMEDNLLSDWAKFNSAIDSMVQKQSFVIPYFRRFAQGLTDIALALSEVGVNEELEKTVKQIKEYSESLKPTIKNIKLLNLKTEAYGDALEAAKKQLKDLKEEGSQAEIANIDPRSYDRLENSIDFLTGTMRAYSLAASTMQDEMKENAKRAKIEREQQEMLARALAHVAEARRLGSFIDSSPNLKGKTDFSDTNLNPIKFDKEALSASLDEYLISLETGYDKIKGVTIDFSNEIEGIDIGGMIGRALTDSIVTLTQGLVHGKKSLSSIFDEIKGILGSAMTQIGSAMIAYGVAFSLLIKNPVLALPAGIALVAAGAAISGSVKKLNSDVGGSRPSTSGGFTGNLEGQSIIVNLAGEFVASGTDLKMVLDEQDRQDDRLAPT